MYSTVAVPVPVVTSPRSQYRLGLDISFLFSILNSRLHSLSAFCLQSTVAKYAPSRRMFPFSRLGPCVGFSLSCLWFTYSSPIQSTVMYFNIHIASFSASSSTFVSSLSNASSQFSFSHPFPASCSEPSITSLLPRALRQLFIVVSTRRPRSPIFYSLAVSFNILVDVPLIPSHPPYYSWSPSLRPFDAQLPLSISTYSRNPQNFSFNSFSFFRFSSPSTLPLYQR